MYNLLLIRFSVLLVHKFIAAQKFVTIEQLPIPEVTGKNVIL